jgi:hypothetical protein
MAPQICALPGRIGSARCDPRGFAGKGGMPDAEGKFCF